MSHRKGFTLVELLVVITIISILAGMLLPVLARAREAARRTVCSNNLRQCGYGLNAYADSEKGWYPPGYVSSGTPGIPFGPNCNSWHALVAQRLDIPVSMGWQSDRITMFKCPSDQVKRVTSRSPASYSLSTGTNWHNGISWPRKGGQTWDPGSVRVSQVRSPSRCPAGTEYWSKNHRLWNSSCNHIVAGSFQPRDSGYHDNRGGSTFLFCDQHVKFISPGYFAYNGPAIKYGDWRPLTP